MQHALPIDSETDCIMLCSMTNICFVLWQEGLCRQAVLKVSVILHNNFKNITILQVVDALGIVPWAFMQQSLHTSDMMQGHWTLLHEI